jgi:hypothetical protein
MKVLPIILISVSLCFASLDSLVGLSKSSENKAENSGSLFRHHLRQINPVILTPPNKLFGESYDVGLTPPGVLFSKSVSGDRREHESSFSDMSDLNNQITDLKVTVAKQSVILESLQKQSDAHSENLSFTAKMTDSIIGALVTIIVAYVSTRRRKQDKS